MLELASFVFILQANKFSLSTNPNTSLGLGLTLPTLIPKSCLHCQASNSLSSIF